jgi:hypothetical protein
MNTTDTPSLIPSKDSLESISLARGYTRAAWQGLIEARYAFLKATDYTGNTVKIDRQIKRLSKVLQLLTNVERETDTATKVDTNRSHAMAKKEGEWAWAHGEPLDACPYGDDKELQLARSWRLGWTELDELSRQLDVAHDNNIARPQLRVASTRQP